MSKNTKLEEISIHDKSKENIKQEYLSDGTKQYEIKRSDSKNELQSRSPNKFKKAIIYGDFLGTAKM